jgi:hypothetical protein
MLCLVAKSSYVEADVDGLAYSLHHPMTYTILLPLTVNLGGEPLD